MVTRKIYLILFIFVLLALTFAGCGVPEEQFTALQSQLASVQADYDASKSKLSSAQTEIEKLKNEVTSQTATLTSALAQAKSANDTLQKRVAELEGKVADYAAVQKKAADLESRVNTILDTKLTQYYRFSHRFYHYDWTVAIPLRTYFYYKDLPRPTNYNVMVTEPAASSLLDVFARYLRDAAITNDLRKTDVVSLVGTFTRMMPHNDKEFTTPYDGYPRYPIETLIEQGGDSEDTSILAAALLIKEGYDVVLFRFDQPKHVALGVNLPTASGRSWEYQGNRYYYMETTARNWELGETPPPFQSAIPTIVPLGK